MPTRTHAESELFWYFFSLFETTCYGHNIGYLCFLKWCMKYYSDTNQLPSTVYLYDSTSYDTFEVASIIIVAT